MRVLLVVLGVLLITGFCDASGSLFMSCRLSHLLYPFFRGENRILKYHLFTRSNPKDACELQPTEESLKKCNFNPKVKTKVLTHGFVRSVSPHGIIYAMKDKLLQVDDYNVVVFDYSAYTTTHDYTRSLKINGYFAVAYGLVVGLKLSAWMRFLHIHTGVDLKTFHLSGLSLGTAIISVASKTSCGLGRITYAEAPVLFYMNLPKYFHPSQSDAEFVDAIHTDGSYDFNIGLGYKPPYADIDFYPNKQRHQPMCAMGRIVEYAHVSRKLVNSTFTALACNHLASWIYYFHSMDKSCKYLGRICDSYENYHSGKCDNATVCEMGFYAQRIPGLPPNSKCYLKTSADSPYCLN